MVRLAESTVEPSGMPVANWSRARYETWLALTRALPLKLVLREFQDT